MGCEGHRANGERRQRLDERGEWARTFALFVVS